MFYHFMKVFVLFILVTFGFSTAQAITPAPVEKSKGISRSSASNIKKFTPSPKRKNKRKRSQRKNPKAVSPKKGRKAVNKRKKKAVSPKKGRKAVNKGKKKAVSLKKGRKAVNKRKKKAVSPKKGRKSVNKGKKKAVSLKQGRKAVNKGKITNNNAGIPKDTLAFWMNKSVPHLTVITTESSNLNSIAGIHLGKNTTCNEINEEFISVPLYISKRINPAESHNRFLLVSIVDKMKENEVYHVDELEKAIRHHNQLTDLQKIELNHLNLYIDQHFKDVVNNIISVKELAEKYSKIEDYWLLTSYTKASHVRSKFGSMRKKQTKKKTKIGFKFA